MRGPAGDFDQDCLWIPSSSLVLDHRETGPSITWNRCLSKCFTGSGGKPGCITCHDPHSDRHSEAVCGVCKVPRLCLLTRAKLRSPTTVSRAIPISVPGHRTCQRRTSYRGAAQLEISPRPGSRTRCSSGSAISATLGRRFAVGLVEMAKHGKIRRVSWSATRSAARNTCNPRRCPCLEAKSYASTAGASENRRHFKPF